MGDLQFDWLDSTKQVNISKAAKSKQNKQEVSLQWYFSFLFGQDSMEI